MEWKKPEELELVRGMATEEQIRQYLEIEQAVNGETYHATTDRDEASADMTIGVTYFIVWNGKTIGSIVYYEQEAGVAELEGMAIVPGEYRLYRRGDFASVAMEHVLEELRNKNINMMYLYVMPKNISAIEFYKKYGFQITGENMLVDGYDGRRNRMELKLLPLV